MSKKDPTGRLHRWALYLQQFRLTIKFYKGKDNVVADALSRAPVINISTVAFDVTDWVTAQKEDDFCKVIFEQIRRDPAATPVANQQEDPDFHLLSNGLLAHPSGRIIVPKTLRKELLYSYHDSRYEGGHLGMFKTFQNLKAKYYWPHMRSDVNLYVGNCSICAKRKTHRVCKAPLLPMPTSTYIWQRCAMDCIGPVPESYNGKRHILVIVEYVTKYMIATAIRDTTAKTIARKLIKHLFNPEGICSELLADRASYFEGDLMTELYKQLGTTRQSMLALEKIPFFF